MSNLPRSLAETASSSQQPVDLPPHHQRGSASASESALSSARSSFEQQHMPYPRANGTAAPLSGYGASPAIAHWVVSPSSPPSRRSSASFALPNGNALHPLPSGLSHHDGRPRSSSTPFVSYSYGQSSGRSSGFALSSERGCNNGDGAQGSQPNGRWSPPPSEDPTRPRSVSIPMNGETSPQSHSKSFGSFTMLPAMSEHEDGRGHALPFRHGTHPNYTGHASAVPRFAFLGPVDSPSTFSSANAEDEDLPPPVGYPFKDSYRPAHPSVDQTRRTTPSLNTQVPTSAQLSSRFPPAVASGLASAGPVSPVTSESSAPSPFSAPSPVATSPKTQQARVPAKRSRQSIVASEEADGAACSPTDNSGPSTESSQPETGRYTCPHCRESSFASCVTRAPTYCPNLRPQPSGLLDRRRFGYICIRTLARNRFYAVSASAPFQFRCERPLAPRSDRYFGLTRHDSHSLTCADISRSTRADRTKTRPNLSPSSPRRRSSISRPRTTRVPDRVPPKPLRVR